MNLTSTLGGQFFILEKLKPFGLPLAILMLMVMMVIPLILVKRVEYLL